MTKLIYKILCAILLAPIALTYSNALAESPNLIANASVESSTNEQPLSWSKNNWGTNTPTFSYTMAGHTGRGLSVSVTNYSSGDAKWMANQTAVTAGQAYTYSDYSKSDVASELTAAYMNASGVTTYSYLQSVSESSTWQQNTTALTVPAGAVSVSVYHILYSNGSLQTDDFNLSAQSQPTEPPVSTPTTNLIPNSSFETANGADPAGWKRGGWGTNSPTLSYVSGNAHSGSRSASVSLASVSSGDVKWYTNPVTVSAGTTYTYQDYYTASVSTRVVIVMTGLNGTDSYNELTLAPASSTWALYSGSFTVLAGVQSVMVYHLLDKVGALSIDDVSITSKTETTPPDPQPTSNVIVNPSFEIANGTMPADWQSDKWGTNTAAFTYVNDDGHAGSSSAKVTVSNYSSGDAKWSFTPITNLKTGSQYSLSAWYKTNTLPHVVATYVDGNGANQYLTLPNPLPGASAATTWQQYSTTLDVPTDAKSLTVYFLISSNGWLQTDDFKLAPSTPTGFNAPLISLTFDDGWSSIYTNGLPLFKKYGLPTTQYFISGKLNTSGYMTTAMAQKIQTSGSEIGSHTVTHPDLTLLLNSQAIAELSNSQTKLRQLFGQTTAQTFASPYGTYNANTIGYIKQYYQSHRSTDIGFNSKNNFDPYNILIQDVGTNTTPVQVAAWVAKAKLDKTWLVLLYHTVNNSTNPNDYAVTPAHLDEELSNIKASGVQVSTISQAVAILKSQL